MVFPRVCDLSSSRRGEMHLMYYIGADGKRVYTLQKAAPDGTPTHSAHPGALRRASPRRAAPRAPVQSAPASPPPPQAPAHVAPLFLPPASPPAARFSPDDKFSRQRVTIKKRFGLLPTQKPIEEA